MRVLMNRKPVVGPWGGGNLFVKAIVAAAGRRGHQIVHDLTSLPDAVILVDPRYDELRISINEVVALKRQYPQIPVLHRVNECDARKGTNDMDRMLRFTSQFTDISVFVSEWMRKYHLETDWAAPKTAVVYNGVDKNHFRPLMTDQDKIRIVAHHWSNNKLKGFDFYEAVDQFVATQPDYEFTYVGRHCGTFSNATRIVSPLFGQALGDELRLHNVYISGSWFDPGPNHVIEAITSGLSTWVRTDGGGAVEFAGADRVVKDVDELLSLLADRDRLLSPGQSAPEFGTWEECADKYFDILESL